MHWFAGLFVFVNLLSSHSVPDEFRMKRFKIFALSLGDVTSLVMEFAIEIIKTISLASKNVCLFKIFLFIFWCNIVQFRKVDEFFKCNLAIQSHKN